MVKIVVEDINDNVPVFSPSVYNVTLGLDQPTGKTFLLVRAEDEDSGDLGEVEYVVEAGNEDGIFVLDEVTGALSLYSSLDQFPLFYQLRISATDKAGRSGPTTAEVNIHVVLDTSDIPLFDKLIHEFSVSEDASSFSKIGRVMPRMNQKSARLFLYPEDIKDHFDLNPSTGDLSTRISLDHEARPEFLLNIGAVARSGHISYTQVRLRVLDVNDNAPQWAPTLGLVSIPENSPVNTVVSANTAIDADTGDNGDVRYRLVRDADSTFNIDEVTGVLRTSTVSHWGHWPHYYQNKWELQASKQQ